MSEVGEKAKELVDKIFDILSSNDLYMGITKHSKECALIAVDEMIEQLIVLEKYWRNDVINPLDYWYEVKEKIKSL